MSEVNFYTILKENENKSVKEIFEYLYDFFSIDDIFKNRHFYDEMSEDMDVKILQKVADLLIYHGYKVITPQDVNTMEYHRYNLDGTKEVPCDFGIHQDDDNGKVHTAIFYTRTTAQGGELVFYDCDSKKAKVIDSITPEKGMCVLMRGDIYHLPNPVYGQGIRECYVFQMKRD